MHKQKQTAGLVLVMIIFCCWAGACSGKVSKTTAVKANSIGSGGQGGSSPETTNAVRHVYLPVDSPHAVSLPAEKVKRKD